MSKCQCTTTKRKKCTRKSSKNYNHDDKYCWQHQDCYEYKDLINNKCGKKKIKYNDLFFKTSHGCFFHPPLKCSHQRDLDEGYKNDIMEVMFHDKNAIVQEEISRILSKIDKNGTRYIPLSGHKCEIDTKAINFENRDLLKECKLSYVEDKDVRGYFIKYKGSRITTYLQNHPMNININFIWKMLIRLSNSIYLLHSNGIVDLNINKNDIIVSNDERPKLANFYYAAFVNNIDYAEMIKHSTGVSRKYVYHYSDIAKDWPLFLAVLSTDNIDELYERYNDVLKLTKKYEKNANYKFVKDTNSDIVKKLFLEAKTSTKDYIEKIVKPNIYKVDTFMLFNTFKSLFTPKYLAQFLAENDDLTKKLLYLMYNSITPYVDKQYDINQVTRFMNINKISKAAGLKEK